MCASSGGAVLLDDLHNSQGHARDATDVGSSRPGHRQTDRGRHYEEVRPGSSLSDRRTQLLAAYQAARLGALRRTVFFRIRQGQLLRAKHTPRTTDTPITSTNHVLICIHTSRIFVYSQYVHMYVDFRADDRGLSNFQAYRV